MTGHLKNLKQSVNDTAYDGIEYFTKICQLCKIGDIVVLEEARKGLYNFWINDYCYTGWLGPEREIVKAHLLIENLPLSFTQPLGQFKWIVDVSSRSGVNEYRELIMPTDEDGVASMEMFTRFFIGQSHLSLRFYKNVENLGVATLYSRKRTYKGLLVQSWRDVIDVYSEALTIAEYAKEMAKRGSSTYGCMARSNNFHTKMPRVYAELSSHFKIMQIFQGFDYSVRGGNSLAGYLLRELNELIANNNMLEAEELIRIIDTRIKFVGFPKPTIPHVFTVESTQTYFNGCVGTELTNLLGEFN